MAEIRTDSVFRSIKKAEINPTVLKGVSAVESLGFRRNNVPQEVSQRLERSFMDFFNRSVVLTEDHEKLLGGEKEDPKRKNLPVPDHSIIEKDGKYFFEISFGERLKLITDSEPRKTFFKLFELYEGLPTQHVLVKGRDGSYIDLSSVTVGKKAENLFSFSGRHSGFAKARKYEFSDDRVLEYGPQLTLNMPTKGEKDLIWDTESLIYLYLHENSHASLVDHDANIPWKQNERNANALALNLIRRLSKEFPESMYFDKNELREWIEKQLREGYDFNFTPEDIEKSDYEIEDLASNELRAIARNKLSNQRDKTD